MRYLVINLNALPSYHISGRSVNLKPMLHLGRTLNDYEMFFVTDGVLWIEQQEETGLRENEVLFHVKGQGQKGTRYAENSFYWWHFDGEIFVCETQEEALSLCKDKEKWIFFAERFRLSEPERVAFFLTQLNHYSLTGRDTLVKDYLLAALFAELARQYQSVSETYLSDRRFAEVLAFLSLYVDKDVSIVELANRFDYNPKYLSRLFRKYTGITARDYITQTRVRKAEKMLVVTTESVKQIAYSVGFADEYYFMRVFKKQTGMTPKQYRNAYNACRYT